MIKKTVEQPVIEISLQKLKRKDLDLRRGFVSRPQAGDHEQTGLLPKKDVVRRTNILETL